MNHVPADSGIPTDSISSNAALMAAAPGFEIDAPHANTGRLGLLVRGPSTLALGFLPQDAAEPLSARAREAIQRFIRD